VKQRRNQFTVNEILKNYYNKSSDRREKKKAINKIFPPKNFGLHNWQKHPST
jgi:hypothetical protein